MTSDKQLRQKTDKILEDFEVIEFSHLYHHEHDADELRKRIEALIHQDRRELLERLLALPNIEYANPHVQAIYKSAIEAELSKLTELDEEVK